MSNNNYQKCAAKDYLRAAGCITEDLRYAVTRCESTGCISTDFIEEAKWICKAASELSENLKLYSSSRSVLALASDISKFCTHSYEELSRSRRYCRGNASPAKEYSIYKEHSNAVKERLMSELGACDINERINCDYLTEICCIMEGLVRMAENALSHELCRAVSPCVIHMSKNGRTLLNEIEECRRRFT